MSKKLAIKGHATRGKEVIELLEMMGGTNPFSKNDGIVIGNKTTNCYYISEDTASKYISWDYIGPEEIDRYEIFTLEEFLKEYPHKIGDKVVDCYGDSRTIKSMGWLEDLETMVYAFEENSVVLAANFIKFAYDNTTPAEETITPTPDITADVTDKNNCGIQCPDGYEFYDENGNLIGTKVMMRPKKPVYPKTYEECIELLHLQDSIVEGRCGYEWRLVSNLQKLLLCRDAYWKIAGEEMRLDKSWEPDEEDEIFIICHSRISGIYKSQGICTDNFILAFPTAEMRDAFYENFKKEIEQCKELL